MATKKKVEYTKSVTNQEEFEEAQQDAEGLLQEVGEFIDDKDFHQAMDKVNELKSVIEAIEGFIQEGINRG